MPLVLHDAWDFPPPSRPGWFGRRHDVNTQVQDLVTEVEAIGTSHEVEVASVYGSMKQNGLVATIGAAFNDHLPLLLRPDDIMTTVLQGISHHIVASAEQFRSLFVSMPNGEKQTLVVERGPNFVPGVPPHRWTHVFSDFGKQIRGATKGNFANLMVPTFTTTMPENTVAYYVNLMDSMSKYFDFEVHSKCGIASITLSGTAEDWMQVKRQVEQIVSEYKLVLSWWTEHLFPILDQFIQLAKDPSKANKKFWCDMYNRDSASGTEAITGWILQLFPYFLHPETSQWMKSPYIGKLKRKNKTDGPDRTFFPSGMSKVPFVWQLPGGQRLQMDFLAGQIGFAVDRQNHAASCVYGWVVGYQRKRKAVVAAEVKEADAPMRAVDRTQHDLLPDYVITGRMWCDSCRCAIRLHGGVHMDNSKIDLCKQCYAQFKVDRGSVPNAVRDAIPQEAVFIQFEPL